VLLFGLLNEVHMQDEYPKIQTVYFPSGKIQRVEWHTDFRQVEVYKKLQNVQLEFFRRVPGYVWQTVSSVGNGFYSNTTPWMHIAYEKMPEPVRRAFLARSKGCVDAKAQHGELNISQ